MNRYKFTYIWWGSIHKDEEIVEANSEEEAYKKFCDDFGYAMDILNCEQINE